MNKIKSDNTLVCIISGELMEYDDSDSGFNQAPEHYISRDYLFIYLGCGTIWSIDGIRQQGRLALHFWKKIKIQDILRS
jgi:hypothetical protein